METTPVKGPDQLRLFVGQTIFTAVESARLGYATDSYLVASIAAENIVNFFYNNQTPTPDQTGRHINGRRTK